MASIKKIVLWYLLVIVICLIGRLAFYLVYYSVISSSGETGVLPMLYHGLLLDIAIAGYVSVLPILVMIVAQWWNGKALLWIWRVYQAIAVSVLVIAFVANIALYRYWGFPLDSTPLFFLENSPEEFISCLTVWQIIFYPLCIILLVALSYYAVDRLMRPQNALGIKRTSDIKKSIGFTFLYLLIAGAVFIGIRGGFTVSVNNVGKVYFSSNIRLNHAAVNPVFSFIDDVTSDEDFSQQYRFMDGKEADRLFEGMVYTKQRETPDSILTPVFKKAIADGKKGKGDGVRVVIVIMESFSRYIMSDGGHNIKGVVPNLEKLASEGVYFTNFYANSFRTDRGMMSILSGFPAQPTMSLMKFPHKTNNLYSIARSLKREGFATHYVYGGDANFTNCRSYLMGTGFEDIIAEEDYPASIKRDKWGVNDGALFERALSEIAKDKDSQNVLRVIQTSSSHEPFDVPWHKFQNEPLNAFSYTDDCIGKFVSEMRKRPDWDRTLLVFVPDHLGCYPEDIDNYQLYRYWNPLIFAGGAISGPRKIDTIGSQQDIAATLLTLLGVSHKEFIYSKDMLDPDAPHFAFFDVPDAMGLVTTDGAVIYDNTSGKIELNKGNGAMLLPKVEAYLQKLYDDIAAR